MGVFESISKALQKGKLDAQREAAERDLRQQAVRESHERYMDGLVRKENRLIDQSQAARERRDFKEEKRLDKQIKRVIDARYNTPEPD